MLCNTRGTPTKLSQIEFGERLVFVFTTQEQGKQLIINQQKQIWEQLQRNESELEQRSTDSPELQQTRDKTQSSYFNVPLEQTSKGSVKKVFQSYRMYTVSIDVDVQFH